MGKKMYFAGSIYERVSSQQPGAQEVIAKGGPGYHLMTKFDGRPALVTDNELFVFSGKVEEFQSVRWSHQGLKVRP